MDRDFYNKINADVIRNKEIQKATGISVGAEKQKLMQGEPTRFVEFKPFIESWKTGWRIRITRVVIEDFGFDLNLPRFYTKGARNFDTNEYYFYPFPIAFWVTFKNWLVYHIHEIMTTLNQHEIKERRIKRDLEEAKRQGFLEGRDFEFRTAQEHERGMNASRNQSKNPDDQGQISSGG